MGTNVEYGPIVLQNVLTESFEQQAVMDDSNTDLLYHKFNIRVSGVVATSSQGGTHGADVSGATATEMMANLQNTLLHPRQAFRYKIGDEILVQATPDSRSAYRDVNNGPKPQNCNITHVASNRVFRVSFSIEIAIVLCGTQDLITYGIKTGIGVQASSSPVLNHRWSLSETKNQDFYTTRSWSGTLRTAHSNFSPQWMRHVVVPKLHRGYRRKSMTFTATPDGLNLKYEIVDEEMHAAPPYPATSWAGSYKESVGAGGRIGIATVNVEMTGPPGVNKRDLLTRCAAVCYDRIGWHVGPQLDAAAKTAHLRSAVFQDYLHENRVGMQVEFFRTTRDHQRYLGVVFDKMGKPLSRKRVKGYSRTRWLTPNPYDSKTPAGAFVMYLQSPCDNRHGMVLPARLNAERPKRTETYDPGKPETSYGVVDNLQADQQNELSTDHAKFPYTYVELSSRYVIKHGKYQMPIADDEPEEGAATCVVVSLHAPIAQRIQHMVAERISEWPQLPKPEDNKDPNGIQETLLSEDLLVHGRELMADGKSYMHRIEMEYVYALSRPPTATEQLRAGSDPSDATKPKDSTFPLKDRKAGLIE
jgi:hypothetical protein